MRRKKLSVIAISLLAVALCGCGGSESGGDQTIGQPTGTKGAVSGVSVTLPKNGQAVLLSTGKTLAEVTQADPTQAISVIGSDQCINCHEGLTVGSEITPEIISRYLVGEHVIHSSHITEEEARTSGCYVCHDPIGDGPLVEAYVADPDTNVPADGLAAVTCQVCHGAGGQHYGTGPMPDPLPQAIVCGQCHDKQWTDTTTLIPLTPGGTTTDTLANISGSHVNFHPEGYGIYSDYESSLHAASINSHVILDDNPTSVNTPCARCHTDQGGRKYKGVNTVAGLGSVQPVTAASPVQCRTCHDPHGPDNHPNSLLMEPTTGASAEYNTCTNCHQGENAAPLSEGEQNIPFQGGIVSYSTTANLQDQVIYHADRYDHLITYNHYDDPSTNTTNTSIIEGIVIDKAGTVVNQTNASATSDEQPRSCRPCHNVHAVDIRGTKPFNINWEWAHSAHAGMLGVFKDNAAAAFVAANPTLETTAAETRAVKAAGLNQNDPDPELAAYAAPFVINNWDDTQTFGGCQRCHTATGAKNYLNGPATYDPANNDFSYLYQWTATTGSGQNELLYCWACHVYNNGARRNPGPITAPYPGDSVVFPDLNDSNICVSCHSGLKNGQNIKGNNFDPTQNFAIYDSHYLSAAGTIFRTTGYEYTDADYANPSNYAHDLIGTTAAPVDTGTHGPCVTCHMQDDKDGHADHLLTPFAIQEDSTKAGYGEPIDNTPNVFCSKCHGSIGPVLTPDVFGALSDGFADALTALSDALQAKGIYYDKATFPYFFNNATTHDSTTYYTNWPSEQILGAAFNLNLLEWEPGAFAHNDFYAKRLIFDSIDWVTNGKLTGTINLAAYPKAANWYQNDNNTANDNAVTRP